MQPVISGLKALMAPRRYAFTQVDPTKTHYYKSGVSTRDFKVIGRILYEDDQLPDAMRSIEVRHPFFRWLLGKTETNKNGEFEILVQKTRSYSINLPLQIMDDIRPFAMKTLWGNTMVAVDEIRVPLQSNTSYDTIDIGTQVITFANASKSLNEVEKPPRSHMPSLDFFRRLNKAALAEVPKIFFITLFKRWLTTEQVQRICDAFGPQFPKEAPTPENLIDALLNQICAVDYEETETGTVWTTTWPHSELKFPGSLADVRVVGHFDENRNLLVESITIQFGKDAEPITVKPNDARIPWAVYVARSMCALDGEIKKHLMLHTLDGIWSDSFYKYIKPNNPLFALLDPLMGETRWINYLAFKGAISGPGSPIGESALTDETFYRILEDAVRANADYRTGSPKSPLNHQHYLAIGGNQNFNDLLQFFTGFIETNREAIHSTWHQNRRWAQSMKNRLDAIVEFTRVEENPTIEDEKEIALALALAVHRQTFFHYAIHSRQTLLTDVRGVSLGILDQALDENGNFNPYGNATPASAVLGAIIARILLSFEAQPFATDPAIHPKMREMFNRSVEIGKYPGYPDANKTHRTLKI